MHVAIEDWKNGWSGISVGIDPDEIDRLIELLKMIKEDPEQHFTSPAITKEPEALEISKSLSEVKTKNTT